MATGSSNAPARPRGLVRHARKLIVAAAIGAQSIALVPGTALAADISFRAATWASSPSTTSLALTTPTGTAGGDALLAGVTVRGKPNIKAPSGWTLVLKTQASNTMTQAIYVRVAGAAEPASATWTFSKAVGAAGGMLSYVGVDPAAPIDLAKGQANAASTSITAPSITTTSANDVLVGFFGIAQATGITPSSTLVERYDVSASGTFKIAAEAADERLTAAGPTGNRTAVAGTSGGSVGQLVALRPVAEAPQDTTPPTVTSRNPANDATDVPLASSVTATFSEGVTGVTGQTFTLAGPGGSAIAGQVSYAPATRTATLDPTADLTASTSYTATLSSGITDAAGNALSGTSWTFQTAADNPPPPPPPPSEIGFRSSSTGANDGTIASIVLPQPAGVQQGDILIAVVTTRGTPVVSAPNGWSTVVSTANGTAIQQVAFVHAAGASEPANYTFSLSKAASATGGILAYTGVDTTSPIDAAAGAINASSATITAPSITTSTDNGILVALFGIARLSTFSTATGMNERYEVGSPSTATYKTSGAADDAALGAAGLTGTRSTTGSGAAGNVAQMIALRAADAPGVAAFDAVPLSGVAPLTVSFTDRSTGGPTSWTWDFDGDAQTDSTSRNPSHVYTEPGEYTVSLTITSDGATDTEVKTNYVHVDSTPPGGSGDQVLVGAGDIAECTGTDDEKTAALLGAIPGTVFTLGDNVYENGTTAEWNDCYDPTWGLYKARTRPALGDHDHTVGAPATEYFNYFGQSAGDPSKGYYSYDLGAWHIIVLNTECSLAGGCGATSPQVTWLKQDLAANTSACTLAYWHVPLYTSAKSNNAAMAVFWQALLDDGAEVVMNGDSHVYERFAPQDASGHSLATGIREFIVGTGGRGLGTFNTIKANSEVRNSSSFGVLKLTLHDTGYSWEFVPVPGSNAFTDTGSAACH